MIVIKTKADCGIPVCIWDGYNDKAELEGLVWHNHAEDISLLMKELSKPNTAFDSYDSELLETLHYGVPLADGESWKGVTDFSNFYAVWHHGFEYSEKLYFTYKTENLEKTYSLTGFEVVDGYLKIETWKRNKNCCDFYELEEELRDREVRRHLNGLLEYLIMIDSGRRIPVRPNMNSVRKEARTVMRKQTPFRLKDVLGWKMFSKKDSNGRDNKDEENNNIEPGHSYDEGRNNLVHRDFSPEEIRKMSTKKDNFFNGYKSISTLPENFTFEEIVTAHGMIQHEWIKNGEDIPLSGYEKDLQDMDKAA